MASRIGRLDAVGCARARGRFPWRARPDMQTEGRRMKRPPRSSMVSEGDGEGEGDGNGDGKVKERKGEGMVKGEVKRRGGEGD